MSRSETFQGTRFDIIDPHLGAGAQGGAKLAHLMGRPEEKYVIKALTSSSPALRSRTSAISALALPRRNPFLAGPISFEPRSGGVIAHVAPYAAGKSLDQDIQRSLPARLEVAHHAACNWTSCEEAGYFHGDIRLPHLLISKAGAVSIIDHDNGGLADGSIPAPPMAGDRMMMAPELRDLKTPPTIESDRFAYAVWFHMLLFQRHPSEGLASNPKEMDQVMSSGTWPGLEQQKVLRGTPMASLGPDIPQLFARAFSTVPGRRPTADEWRRVFSAALKSIDIHVCGSGFVQAGQRECPWCGQEITAEPALRVVLPEHNRAFRVQLEDRVSFFLGRQNLGAVSRAMSARHLELYAQDVHLFLRHCGRNRTLIQSQGKWFKLNEVWWPLDRLETHPLELVLGDAVLRLSIETA